MIKGVHTMLFSSEAEELRAFTRDKLDFRFTDTGGGWLILDLPEADMGVQPAGEDDAKQSGAINRAPTELTGPPQLAVGLPGAFRCNPLREVRSSLPPLWFCRGAVHCARCATAFSGVPHLFDPAEPR